jgi:hypothetical protein
MKQLFPMMAALGLAACVTINIYFPAAAAEKVADKIIDEVWQIQKDRASVGKREPQNNPPVKESP